MHPLRHPRNAALAGHAEAVEVHVASVFVTSVPMDTVNDPMIAFTPSASVVRSRRTIEPDASKLMRFFPVWPNVAPGSANCEPPVALSGPLRLVAPATLSATVAGTFTSASTVPALVSAPSAVDTGVESVGDRCSTVA